MPVLTLSLRQRLGLMLFGVTLIGALFTAIALFTLADSPYYLALALVTGFALLILLCRRWANQLGQDMASLEVALLNLSDANFSVSMPAPKLPEMRAIAAQMNRSFSDLRQQRKNIYQRELMLDTMIETSPMAMILCGASGHIIFANAAARELLFNGDHLAGCHLVEALNQTQGLDRDELARVILQGRETFFSVLMAPAEQASTPSDEGDDHQHDATGQGLRSFHYACSHFSIDRQPHRLHLLKDITREVNRQEAASWKKTIRIISHELNNSLAPISSMAHSGQLLLERGDHARLSQVLTRIESGVASLYEFIQRYASFARLPKPNLAPLCWPNFIQQLQEHYPFQLPDGVPDCPLSADAAQLQQALINVLKNAHESGSPSEQVIVRFKQTQEGCRIDVIDQGGGMSGDVMEQALLPFYSTKPLGSGIGLALCREIVEAHQGQMSLDNYQHGLRVSINLPNVV